MISLSSTLLFTFGVGFFDMIYLFFAHVYTHTSYPSFSSPFVAFTHIHICTYNHH